NLGPVHIGCRRGLAGDLGRPGPPRRLVRLLPVAPLLAGLGGRRPSSWPPDRGYYREGWWLASNPGFRGKVGANHRMLSTYLNSLAAHGLTLEEAAEPPPGPKWEQRLPGAAPVPLYLAGRCRRVDRGPRSRRG